MLTAGYVTVPVHSLHGQVRLDIRISRQLRAAIQQDPRPAESSGRLLPVALRRAPAGSLLSAACAMSLMSTARSLSV